MQGVSRLCFPSIQRFQKETDYILHEKKIKYLRKYRNSGYQSTIPTFLSSNLKDTSGRLSPQQSAGLIFHRKAAILFLFNFPPNFRSSTQKYTFSKHSMCQALIWLWGIQNEQFRKFSALWHLPSSGE